MKSCVHIVIWSLTLIFWKTIAKPKPNLLVFVFYQNANKWKQRGRYAFNCRVDASNFKFKCLISWKEIIKDVDFCFTIRFMWNVNIKSHSSEWMEVKSSKPFILFENSNFHTFTSNISKATMLFVSLPSFYVHFKRTYLCIGVPKNGNKQLTLSYW